MYTRACEKKKKESEGGQGKRRHTSREGLCIYIYIYIYTRCYSFREPINRPIRPLYNARVAPCERERERAQARCLLLILSLLRPLPLSVHQRRARTYIYAIVRLRRVANGAQGHVERTLWRNRRKKSGEREREGRRRKSKRDHPAGKKRGGFCRLARRFRARIAVTVSVCAVRQANPCESDVGIWPLYIVVLTMHRK